MKHRFVRFFAVLAVAVTLLAAGTAWALDLGEAKSRGLVGETLQGYLSVINDVDGARSLVDTINLQRRQHYREIARKNGTSLDAVEAIVGKTLIERAAPGEYVQDAGGNWVRKP